MSSSSTHSRDAVRTQYITHSALPSFNVTLSLNTRPMLRRSTTSSVACEKKNREYQNPSLFSGCLVVSWLPRHPLAVSS